MGTERILAEREDLAREMALELFCDNPDCGKRIEDGQNFVVTHERLAEYRTGKARSNVAEGVKVVHVECDIPSNIVLGDE